MIRQNIVKTAKRPSLLVEHVPTVTVPINKLLTSPIKFATEVGGFYRMCMAYYFPSFQRSASLTDCFSLFLHRWANSISAVFSNMSSGAASSPRRLSPGWAIGTTEINLRSKDIALKNSQMLLSCCQKCFLFFMLKTSRHLDQRCVYHRTCTTTMHIQM